MSVEEAASTRRKPSRLEHKLLRKVTQASRQHRLLEPGDRVMVCVSGGKDSLVMLHLLRQVQRRVPFPLDLVAVNLDQKQPGFPADVLPRYFREHGYPYEIVEADTYSVVTGKLPPDATFCSLCSRLRRGILYTTARRLGCTKVALGHHRDDIIETLLLNLFFAGQLKAMPPRLRSDDGENVVIRPLALCDEADVAALARQLAMPVVPCGLCGSQANLQRQRIKRLLAELSAENPKVPGNIFAALGNLVPSHLLDPAVRAAVGLDPVTGERPRSVVAQHQPQQGQTRGDAAQEEQHADGPGRAVPRGSQGASHSISTE